MPEPRIPPLEEQQTLVKDPFASEESGLHVCPSCHALFRTGPGHCPLDGARLALTEQDPNIGLLLAGEYRVEALVGQGAMGRVYRALHVPTQRVVAIKTLYGDVAASESMRARFRLEARLARRVHHRNVVSALDFIEAGATTFTVLELAEGGCLEQLLEQLGTVPRDDALDLTRGILKGLAELHGRGIIHRDIKPSNILLQRTAAGLVPRITDLGVARLVDGPPGKGPGTTGTGFVVGSPSFMAPEQARGCPCDARSDIYAVGATLHAMLVGTIPFSGEPHRILYDKATNACPILGQVEGLDRDLQILIGCFTAHDPADRPQSAEEAIAMVDRVRLRAPFDSATVIELEEARRLLRQRPDGGTRRNGYGRSSARRSRPMAASAAAAAAIALGALVGASPLPRWACERLGQADQILVEAIEPSAVAGGAHFARAEDASRN